MDKKKVICIILSYVRKYKALIFSLLFLELISIVSMLLVPITVGKAIDAITDEYVDFNILIKYTALIFILVLITLILKWSVGIINNFITSNITRDIRKDAFNNIVYLPFKYLDSHPYGEIVSRVITDVDTFSDGLLVGFTELFSGIITIVLTLFILFRINYIIALIVFLLTPISIFVAKFISSRIHKYFIALNEKRTIETSYVEEMITNMKIVKAFSYEDESFEKFEELNDNLCKASLKSVFFSSLVNPSTRFVNAVIYAIVALTGALIIINDESGLTLTVGLLSSILSYSREYMKPFNEISGVITELTNSIVCAGKVFSIINEEREKDLFTETNLDNNKVLGNISFEHVYFSYTKEYKLIENLNLNIKKGMRVAIVGPTGSGKTTLINLLMRFYDPTSGDIVLDSTPTAMITRKSLRSNYGMVLQETWLKSGTVFENITLGKPEASIDEVISACKETFAHNFITRLKNGYNTFIHEGTDSLSLGERQLLCITRVMLLKPPILILDEATSSIDTRTELIVQRAFSKLMKGRTSFIVAHRLQTILEADLILVMNEGKVIEEGNHQELLRKRGFYYKLYNSQFENVKKK